MLRAAGLALPLLARDTSSCKKRFIGRLAVFLGLRASAGGEALSGLWDRGSAKVSLLCLLSPSWLSLPFSLWVLETPKRHKTAHYLSPSTDLLIVQETQLQIVVFGRQKNQIGRKGAF